jgi:hypothetical protein
MRYGVLRKRTSTKRKGTDTVKVYFRPVPNDVSKFCYELHVVGINMPTKRVKRGRGDVSLSDKKAIWILGDKYQDLLLRLTFAASAEMCAVRDKPMSFPEFYFWDHDHARRGLKKLICKLLEYNGMPEGTKVEYRIGKYLLSPDPFFSKSAVWRDGKLIEDI